MKFKIIKDIPTFIRDTREHEDKGWKWRAVKGVSAGTVTKKLDYGDYSVEGLEDIVAIERKGSASELMSNLLTKDRARFIKEVEILSKFPYSFIVCEFSLSDLKSSIKFIPKGKRKYFSFDKAIGSISSIMIKYKVPFIFAGKNKERTRKGRTYKFSPGKDLSRKLLIKAHKYYLMEKTKR